MVLNFLSYDYDGVYLGFLGVDDVGSKIKERLPQLDLFRAIAIFCVIQVHSFSFAAAEQALSSPIHYFYNGMNIFFRVGTSSFIFLSSFVLFYNYYSKPYTLKRIGRFYKKRLLYIILPYMLVSCCYFLVVTWYTRELFQLPVTQLLGKLSIQLLTGSAYTHLYFVFLSIQFYLLFPLLLWLIQSMGRSKAAVWWIIPLGLMLQWAFFIWNKYDLHLVNKGSFALSYLSFYLLGAAVAVYFDHMKDWLGKSWSLYTTSQKIATASLWGGWLILSLVDVQLFYMLRQRTYIASTYLFELVWNFHLLLSALVLLHASFVIYRHASARWLRGLTRLGELSFAIYLFHPAVLLVYRQLRLWLIGEQIGRAYFLYIVAGAILALGLSWLFTQFCFKRLPYASVILGNPPASMKKILPLAGAEDQRTASL